MDAIRLWSENTCDAEGRMPSLTPFLIDDAEIHGAILVIPGGGYGCVCEQTEGTPIAGMFNRLGFHAFVLDYRVAPHRYPAPQQDGFRAMKLIRGNAARFRVDPECVAACGFSAGGHLAASLGVLEKEVDASAGDGFDSLPATPDYLILGYPVISLEARGHADSGRNLLGDRYDAEFRRLSLQYRVTRHTPPAFLWHTIRDQIVPYRNSVLFAEAMAEKGRPCELHLFPCGDHGMLLGLGTKDVSAWPRLAVNFIAAQRAARAAETGGRAETYRRLYTNAEQARRERKLFRSGKTK